MNILINSTRAAVAAPQGSRAYFTQDSHVASNRPVYERPNLRRSTTEMSSMSYRKLGSRVPYASALYAAAIAALLSACTQSSVEPLSKETGTHVSETASDVPEVVITASRETPKAIG
jgi:hypothetical protein